MFDLSRCVAVAVVLTQISTNFFSDNHIIVLFCALFVEICVYCCGERYFVRVNVWSTEAGISSV